MKNKLLIIAMYDLKVKNIAPARRMSAVINAFQNVKFPFEAISGSRRERMHNTFRLLFSNKGSEFSGVYIESTNSGMLLSEFLLLLKYRLKNVPISVYLRDIYPKYKSFWLGQSYRVIIAHLFWLMSYYIYKKLCDTIYVPSMMMAKKLSLKNYEILTPGMVKFEKDLGEIKQNTVFYAGGTGNQYDIECLLSACNKLSKEIDITVFLFCRKGEVDQLRRWSSASWLNILHNDLEQLDFQPQVSVIPLSKTEYADIAFPVKLMDYISINTPILSSNSIVTKKFINKHQIGLIANAGDVDDYYTKLKIMLGDQELYKKFIANISRLRQDPKITWEFKCNKILKDLGFI